MPHYRLTGNYGTFEISRVVEAANFDEAYEQTGIMDVLADAGWTIESSPDGEEWSIAQC